MDISERVLGTFFTRQRTFVMLPESMPAGSAAPPAVSLVCLHLCESLRAKKREEARSSPSAEYSFILRGRDLTME